mgnify:CR=1 FL=1
MAEVQKDLVRTLTEYGKLGVMSIRNDVQKLSATGKTADSVRFEIGIEADGSIVMRFLGRKFFKALETGRGPRKSSEYQEFDLNLLEYMKARGIGSDLSEKKRAQLARFIAWKINKEGDSVFKAGGREVYSDNLHKLAREIKSAIVSDFKQFFILEILELR